MPRYEGALYRIMLERYNRFLDIETKELFSGQIENNIRNLYDNYYSQLGGEWIRYYLVAPDGTVLEEKTY